MRVLLFGAAGQVGRALVASTPRGKQLTALDRSGCDLTDAEAIEAAIVAARPDLVINAAAYTAVDKAESEPELSEQINSIAPGRMARAARSCGARLIHISTDFVFDGNASRPYRPGDSTMPLGVYGRTKLGGEIAIAAADVDALILRTAWVYAAKGANFLNTMLRLMRERDTLSVVSDQIGTPTYAASLAQTIWLLANNKARGIHHFTDAGVASWYDFAVAIAEEGRETGILARDVTVKPISTEQYPTPAHRPAFSVLDKSDTWNLLGMAPTHWRANLRVALKESLNNG